MAPLIDQVDLIVEDAGLEVLGDRVPRVPRVKS